MSIGSILGAAVKGAAYGYAGKKLSEGIVDGLASTLGQRAADTAIGTALKAIQMAWSKGNSTSNYISASQAVRVEPYTLIDSRVVRLPYIKDVMINVQKLWTSYYMLAITAENKIGNIKVGQHLDKFAPDRNLEQATRNFLSMESYQFGLPFVGEGHGLNRYGDYCSESAIPFHTPSFEAGDVDKDDKKKNNSVSNTKIVTEVSNLMIGSTVNVSINDGNKSGDVLISVRLRTIGMDPVTMVEVLSLGGEDRSRSARLRKWRVGEITSLRDLILDTDRIDRYRRAAMADRSGYFRKVHDRSTKSMLAHLLTGSPSIGEASSIAVVSKETIREAENIMTGRVDDYNVRQKIFDDSLLILLVVIDEDHETITVYTRDIEEGQTYPISDFKSGGSSVDMGDLVRTFMEGKVPGRL